MCIAAQWTSEKKGVWSLVFLKLADDRRIVSFTPMNSMQFMRIFFFTAQSVHYMRAYHWCFLTPACVGRRGVEAGSSSACPWLALLAGVGSYVLAGVEIGVTSCIFLYFSGC